MPPEPWVTRVAKGCARMSECTCDVSSTLKCSGVYMSRFRRLFANPWRASLPSDVLRGSNWGRRLRRVPRQARDEVGSMETDCNPSAHLAKGAPVRRYSLAVANQVCRCLQG